MFDWYRVATLAHSLPIIGRIARLVTPKQPDITQTTEQGAAGAAAPSTYQVSLLAQRYERMAVINDVRQLLKEDPRLSRANRKMARKAVRRGVIVTVDPIGEGNKALAEKAQSVIERVNRDARVASKLYGWAAMLLAEGDEFLQNVVHNGKLVNIKRMPSVGMERNTDETDQFPDSSHAFTQFDIQSQADIAHFAQWQITHIRWNYVDGERYGESEYLQARAIARMLTTSEQGQVIRRMTRAPQRRVHKIGTPESPGKKEQVDEYRRLNGLMRNPRDAWDPLKVTEDYFSNGLTDVQTLPGDPNIHEIDDIKHNQDVLMGAGAGTPKAVVGLDAENINRDVLKDQRDEWHDDVNLLAETIADGLLESYRIALLLEGINPDALVIKVRVASATRETAEERMGRVTKARQNTVGSGKNAVPDPLISRKTALTVVAEDYGVEDIDAELAAIDAEIEERDRMDEAVNAAAAGDAPPESGEEDDEVTDAVASLDARVRDPGTVQVVIVCVSDPQGRVLIVRRSPNEYRAGEWECPGGHVDPGETLEQAAIREVKEETGLDIVLGNGIVEFEMRDGGRGVFVRGYWVGGQLDLKPDEHDLFNWVMPSEVNHYQPNPPRMFTNVRALMRAPIHDEASSPVADSRRKVAPFNRRAQ